MLTPAEMLAVLKRMTADLPYRPDRTSQDEIESALDSQAEYRQAARREPSSDADEDYWSRRWAG